MTHFPKACALILLLLLTGCGFSPVYGHQEGRASVTEALGDVSIDVIADSNGHYLRNKLIDKMYFNGRPDKPKAKLSVQLKFTETALGIQKDATSTRSRLVLWANFTLRDMNGKVLLSNAAHSVASYNKIDAQYGVLATQRYAYERTLGEAAEQIVNALSLYYAEKPDAPQKRPATDLDP